jgi:hypothetical protein
MKKKWNGTEGSCTKRGRGGGGFLPPLIFVVNSCDDRSCFIIIAIKYDL